MYCSTCGSRVAEGRATCQACGATVARGPIPAQMPAPAYAASYAYNEPVQICPRCGYRGVGASYFSRGGHVAALVGLSVVTSPMMCIGGIGYFLIRHNHRVCPRCGLHWGAHGLRALTLLPNGAQLPSTLGGEGVIPVASSARRAWAILLLIFAGIMVTIGLANGVIPPVVMGLMAGGGGGLLLQGEKRERERRREAIIQSLQLPVLQLAGRKRGRLTVTDVATEMGWPMARAEKVLNSLDDGMRVMSDITDEGVIVYDFIEIRAAQLTPGGGDFQQNALHA